MKITLTLQSPMMIGNKKLHNAYQKSLDYVPGGVLRAAYARAIVERCSLKESNSSGNRYWVEYQDQEACKSCKQLELCQRFAQITFPALYPTGARVFPTTARTCKYPTEHCKKPLIDNLIPLLKQKADRQLNISRECSCGASYEKIEGFHSNGEPIIVPTHPITKTAINSNLRKSKDAALYTLDVLSEKFIENKNIIPTTFSGEINENEDVFDGIKSLRVGAKITSGLGKCQVTYGNDCIDNLKENLEQRLSDFNDCIDDQLYSYVSVDLITDAYLGLEDSIPSDMMRLKDCDYLDALKALLRFPLESEIIFANHRQEPYRGWDTSNTKEKRRQLRLVTKAGSVFVFIIEKQQVDSAKLLEYEINGVGDLREHGFGKVQLCDSFHVDKIGG